MHNTVDERIFETIKQVILKEEFELKNLADKGIYFMPEQAFFYQISKSLILNKQLIFGASKVSWLKERKVGEAGVVDLILTVEKDGNFQTYMFQFKFRDDYEAYVRDVKTLMKIHQHGYHIAQPQLFLCGLVDTIKGENDDRIIDLEANPELKIQRVDSFLAVPTKDEIHRSNVECVVCLWKVLP
jgi:hypothetical protein